MPYGLFDYTPDSTIHTMGATPYLPDYGRQQLTDLFYSKLGTRPTSGGGGSAMDTTLMAYRNPDGSITMSRGNDLGGNPYTLRMPEDPSQIPPTTKPPGGGGGGSCPPGYAPSPSVEPVRPAPAPVPNPNPIDPRVTYPGLGRAEEGVIPQPQTMAAVCAEDPQFCPKQSYPNQSSASYTPPGGWGDYNPYTRGNLGSEDIRNYPEIQAQRNAEMLAAQQKAQQLGRPTDIYNSSLIFAK